jgi:hypothetical protein
MGLNVLDLQSHGLQRRIPLRASFLFFMTAVDTNLPVCRTKAPTAYPVLGRKWAHFVS